MARRLGVTTEKFIYAAAVFSPRVQVSRSIRLAVAWCKNPDAKPDGCLTMVYETAMKYRDTMQLNGPKTENFRRSIASRGMDDSLCLDVWACRALNVDQSKVYNKNRYDSVRRLFVRASKSTGLTLPQLQASQWYYAMTTNGRNPSGFDLISETVLNEVSS